MIANGNNISKFQKTLEKYILNSELEVENSKFVNHHLNFFFQ